MTAVTTLTNAAPARSIDISARSILIIRHGQLAQVIEPGHRDYELVSRPVRLNGGAAVGLLDDADATWEDCEWQ